MIRINELARELEVPSRAVIDILPQFGVTEKKTHSSSIETPVAELVKQHFEKVNAQEEANSESRPGNRAEQDRSEQEFESENSPTVVSSPASTPEKAEEPKKVEEKKAAPSIEPSVIEPPVTAEQPAAAPVATSAPVPSLPTSRPIRPIRPPLSAGGPPIVPPIARPGASTPIRPVVAPKPGQILSGPRQPLPQDVVRPAPSAAQAPAPPAPSATPGTPRLPLPPRPPAPPSPAQSAGPGVPAIPRPPQPQQTRPAHPPVAVVVSPGTPLVPKVPRPQMPSPPRPNAPQQPRPKLAGQPAQRPVVPPNPQLAARLAQSRQSAQIRPGQPLRPQQPPSSPMPGQPQFRGPVRPGQPGYSRSGGPFPGSPQGRGPGGGRGGRPMHPTSPLRPESAAVVTEPGRRHASKPAAKSRQQQIEEQEGRLLLRQKREEQMQAVNKEITISEGITVKELAEKMGVKANLVIRRLVDRKIFATINQPLDLKTAEALARDFGAATNEMSFEEEASWDIELAESSDDQQLRAPVVTIMGHVDHGKTSLLDAIRQADVAEGEAGGITQHIGAYQVHQNGRKIVFIDTPGHEAFTRMRSRGAKVTDIVILVVSADDGVMPQTLEAIDHARAAKVPIIVAINKIDKPDANPERIKQQLGDRGLLAEDWGGDVTMVPISAKAKTNIDLLLEMVLLVADMQNLKANPNRPGIGNVLEAKLDRGRGPVATVLVRNGMLRVGDYFICGSVMGKVRAMYDDRGNQVKEAEPSTPVEILGMESLPETGDQFQVVTDVAKARQIVEYREIQIRDQVMAKNKARIGLEALSAQMKGGDTKDLNLIIKADVGGSAEVLADTLEKLSTEKVRIHVLRRGVGAITEADVLLAATASDALILGFNIKPERKAAEMADKEKIEIRLYSVIYELVDDVRKAMIGLLDPVYKEVAQGKLEVREVFRITKVGVVAGCYVQDGFITRNSEVRLRRNNELIHTGKVEALKRFKNDVSEVKQGFECGVSIMNFKDLRAGDIIESFVMERVEQLTL